MSAAAGPCSTVGRNGPWRVIWSGGGAEARPSLLVGPGGARPAQVRDRPVAQCREMLDDLSAAVEGVRDHTGETGDFAVEQDDGLRRSQLNQSRFRHSARGQDESVDRVAEPLDMCRLQLGILLRMTDDQRVTGGPGLGFRTPHEAEIMRVGDVVDQQRQQLCPPRGPRGRIAQASRDRQDVFAGRSAYPVRIGQCARHGRDCDLRLTSHIEQGDLTVSHDPSLPKDGKNGKHLPQY